MAAVEIKLTGLDGVLKTLQSMPAEVVSKRGGPVRAALRKGAVVIQKQEKQNLLVATSNATTTEARENTGLLSKNVIVSRGKAPSDGKGERYLVRIKRKTYLRRSGKAVTTLKTAQLLEYGSKQQPAEPWIRPAFQAKAAEAIRTIETELLRAIDRIAAKLLKQGGA